MNKKLVFKNTDGKSYPEWQPKTLGSLALFISDGDWIESKDQSQSGIRILQTGNVGEGKFIDKSTKKRFISHERAAELKCVTLETKDILVSRLPDPAGRACFVPENLAGSVTVVDCAIIRVIDTVSSSFLLQYMQSPSYYKQVNSSLSGSTRKRISRSNLELIKLHLPSLEEQKKIAEFFSALDERIDLQTQKVSLLKEQKKGYQQRVFNRELVFTDDNGNAYPEWEEKKLGEVANLYQPETIAAKDLKSKGYPVYGANGQIGFYDKYNHASEQVAVTCRGNTCGTLNYTKPFSWITGNAMVVDPIKDRANKKFLYYRLEVVNFCSIITGSGQPQITRGPLAILSLNIPSLPEQEKIAEFFSALDENIELNERKLELLKEQKKGYLQGIFG